jgi:hypothetical protein
MKKLPLQMGRHLRISQPLALVVLVVGLIVAGFIVYKMTLPNTHYKTPTVNGHTPTPAPGEPGNPGDVSKEQHGQATPTPTPTPKPASGSVTVSDLSITAQDNGSIRVLSQVAGANGGTCSLALTSPSGTPATFTGTVVYSGTYYACNFASTSGVTEAGTWTATLTVNGTDGATGTANINFTK